MSSERREDVRYNYVLCGWWFTNLVSCLYDFNIVILASIFMYKGIKTFVFKNNTQDNVCFKRNTLLNLKTDGNTCGPQYEVPNPEGVQLWAHNLNLVKKHHMASYVWVNLSQVYGLLSDCTKRQLSKAKASSWQEHIPMNVHSRINFIFYLDTDGQFFVKMLKRVS